MTRFGTNIKLNVPATLREKTQAFYQQGMGATHKSPRESLDMFIFEDGFCLGIFYNEETLTPEQLKLGPWLEVSTPDPDALALKLVDHGGTAVKGMTPHHYVAAPGGLVWRLEKTA